MTQVKETLAQGFADGKDLYDFYVGVAQDLGKMQLKQYLGNGMLQSSSGGSIALSSGHTIRPAPGDIVILTTGTSTDVNRAAVVVTAASSAQFHVAPTADLSSGTFDESTASTAKGGWVVRFSVLSTGTIGTTT